MQSFVYVALVAFLGAVAVQGYGPKIHRKHHGGSRKPSRGSHRGAPSRHHGPPHEPQHRPSHHSGPSHQHGHWDNSPEWDDSSDPWGSTEYSGSYDSYGYSDSSERYIPSYEEFRDWYDYFHTKRPCKRPHKKAQTTTSKPTPDRYPPPTEASIPPLTPNTRLTPRPTETTTAVRPDHTITYFTPRPTRTVGPTPKPTVTTGPTTDTEDTTHEEATAVVTETTPTEEEFSTLSPEVQSCIDSCLSTPEYNPVCGTNGETYDNEGKLFCASSCGVTVSLQRRSVCPPPNYDYEDYGNDNEESRTAPPPTTTTTSSFIARTPLSPFLQCMRLCRITAYFTPVCGTDQKTYMNMDRLKCAQSCGEVVEVLCEKPCAACGFNPVTVKTTTLPPTTTGHIGRTTLEPDIRECIHACPVTAEYNPICGSDEVTYINPSHMICAQLCGVAVAVVRLSPCSPRTTTTSTTQAPASTLSPDLLSCIRRCPVTAEYDPVCGTNDLTYTNLGNLECSQFCGINVELKHKSRCTDEFDLGPDGTDSTTSKITPNVNGNKDDVTTPSRSTETSTSLFTSPTTRPTTTESTTASPLMTTVAAIPSSTIGFTIPQDILNNIFGLTITQAPPTTKSDVDKDLNLDSTSTPTTTESTMASSLMTTVVPIPTSTVSFTIQPDILNEIFGPTLTQAPPTTKPSNFDEDEDLDLDSRYGTDTNKDKDTNKNKDINKDKDTDKGRAHHSRITFPK